MMDQDILYFLSMNTPNLSGATLLIINQLCECDFGDTRVKSNA